MRNYTTQMDAARKGILTPEIKTVAQKEHMSTDEMMKLVAEGKVAICANKNHTCLNPEGVGSMLRTKKLVFIVIIGFILGFKITISEPDLQVLAEQVSSVPNLVLILSVALGVGIASIRNDKHAGDDSFGLVALCSIGPILAVLILGLLYHTEGNVALEVISEVENSIELGKLFAVALPKYFKEIAVSLFQIVAFFGIFQIVSLKLNKNVLIKICIGLKFIISIQRVMWMQTGM